MPTKGKWQLDYLLGLKMVPSMTYIHMVQLSSTWNRHPVYATISEDDGHGYFTQQKKKGYAGWKLHDEDAKK